MANIVITGFLFIVAFSLGAMGASSATESKMAKAKEEAYANGYKEGYKNAMSYALTSLILLTSAKNSDS